MCLQAEKADFCRRVDEDFLVVDVTAIFDGVLQGTVVMVAVKHHRLPVDVANAHSRICHGNDFGTHASPSADTALLPQKQLKYKTLDEVQVFT